MVTRRLAVLGPGIILGTAFLSASRRGALASDPLTIFAAASLRDALDAIAGEWAKQGHPAPRISYAGSGALARQIEQGAPADFFISASEDWMDVLSARRAIRAETRRILTRNRLVVVARAQSARLVTVEPGMKAESLHIGGRIAIGDVKAVPAGTYAKEALDRLGLWEALQPHLVQVENVRVALALVARGEVETGIVYASDAAAEPRVKVIGTVPAAFHKPITYPVALTDRGLRNGGTALLDFLFTPASQALLSRYGFAGPA